MSTRKPEWEGGRKQSIHWNLRWEISNWSILEHSVFGVSPKLLKRWSGRRGSNPRRPAWEAGILPLNYSRLVKVKIILILHKYLGVCYNGLTTFCAKFLEPHFDKLSPSCRIGPTRQ